MKLRQVLKRGARYAIFPLLFLTLSAPGAFAWTWANRSTVYNGPGLCVQGDAGIDHLVPNLFSGNLAYDGTYALSQGCGTGLTLPNGWAATRLDVYKWTGTEWAICRGTNWQFGPTGISNGDIFFLTGPSQILNYGGSAACGSGSYGTQAFSYAWDGSAWRGGGVWSGFESVP
jgi:hypothetical protein